MGVRAPADIGVDNAQSSDEKFAGPNGSANGHAPVVIGKAAIALSLDTAPPNGTEISHPKRSAEELLSDIEQSEELPLGHDEARQPVYEYGPTNLESLIFGEINVVSQMRKIYDPDEQTHLTKGIEKEGLYHPPIVCRLNAEECQTYLMGINATYGSNHKLEELKPAQDGLYYVLVAGHRRMRSIAELIERDGLTQDEVFVKCDVYDGLSSFKALIKQLTENIMATPYPWEFATALRELYDVGLVEGRFSDIAGFAREIPFSESRIRDAIRFTLLPESIKKFVEANGITYSVALDLARLHSAYITRHADEASTEQTLLIIATSAMSKDPKERWSPAKVRDVVNGKIDALRMDQVSMEELFDDSQRLAHDRQVRALQAEKRRVVREKLTYSLGNLAQLLWLQEQGYMPGALAPLTDQELVPTIESLFANLWRLLIAAGLSESELAAEAIELAKGYHAPVPDYINERLAQ